MVRSSWKHVTIFAEPWTNLNLAVKFSTLMKAFKLSSRQEGGRKREKSLETKNPMLSDMLLTRLFG